MRHSKPSAQAPSGLEQLVMEFLWENGPSSSETVREGLMKRHPMKEATARTILRRLEAKGYASHVEEGRTYIYSPVRPENIAMRTIRQVIDRFWGGSAQALVAGMVEHEVIDPAELREFSKKLDRLAKQKKKAKRPSS
jgi:BlaI family transcriptional regulator, penicillinase repressor